MSEGKELKCPWCGRWTTVQSNGDGFSAECEMGCLASMPNRETEDEARADCEAVIDHGGETYVLREQLQGMGEALDRIRPGSPSAPITNADILAAAASLLGVRGMGDVYTRGDAYREAASDARALATLIEEG